jgi:minimal PKS ketosynthase (KS/KS alpha)
MDRHVQMTLATAREAMRDSRLDAARLNHDRLAVSLGTALGGLMRLEEEYVVASNRAQEWSVSAEYAMPFLYHSLTPSTLAAEVALAFGAHGPATVLATGSTAGLDALGYGHLLIQDDEADVVIAGGADAAVTPIAMAALEPIKATSHRNHEPERASRPFDRDRDGFVVGEGSAVLILESGERARARGAHIYCEISGFAARSSAYHMTGLTPGGEDLAQVISAALAEARIGPGDLQYIAAHGSGSRQADAHEVAAYKRALEEAAHGIPVSSIKSMVGHGFGSAGALSAATCALAIEHRRIPPTATLEHHDPACDLDLVPAHSRDVSIRAALATAIGLGGFQSALVVTQPSSPTP